MPGFVRLRPQPGPWEQPCLLADEPAAGAGRRPSKSHQNTRGSSRVTNALQHYLHWQAITASCPADHTPQVFRLPRSPLMWEYPPPFVYICLKSEDIERGTAKMCQDQSSGFPDTTRLSHGIGANTTHEKRDGHEGNKYGRMTQTIIGEPSDRFEPQEAGGAASSLQQAKTRRPDSSGRVTRSWPTAPLDVDGRLRRHRCHHAP